MIVYVLKAIVCSGLLLGFYTLFLQSEKTYRFNRFYLLFSILFSFVIPFITIPTTSSSPVYVNEYYYFIDDIQKQTSVQTEAPVENGVNHWQMIIAIYITITLLLLARFIKNISGLVHTIHTSNKASYQNATLVFIDKGVSPFSFLNFIFLDKNLYNGQVEKEILLHELTHVKQKHSADILLVELFMAFAWFNPFLIFYKKSIQLNHEFLADEAVIKTFNDKVGYQQLLLNTIYNSRKFVLSSSFNFLNTKKRFVMMTKITSLKSAILKQALIFPLFLTVIFFFSTEKVEAQEKKKEEKTRPNKKKVEAVTPPFVSFPTIGFTEEGVSQELLNEYASIIEKYKKPNANLGETIYKNISDEDRERLETIFKQMNKEQQSKQVVGFTKPFGPLKKSVPTSAQLQLWKNAKVYGVWINDKRVSNTELNKYTNTDFAHVFVSKLAKNAINYGKHYYQVDLMTNEFYEEYYKKAVANKNNQMFIRHIK